MFCMEIGLAEVFLMSKIIIIVQVISKWFGA